MAAAQEGFRVEASLFPQGKDGPVAECEFIAGEATPDPLFAHVLDRRSRKEAFEPRAVSRDAVEGLSAYGDIYIEGDGRDALRQIATHAWMTEMRTQDAYMESVNLFRIGKREINANPDGIDIGGAMIEVIYAAGLFNREIAEDINDPNVAAEAERTRDIILGSPGLIVQKTPSNTRIDQMNAGRDWLRFNLAATGMGLATRPVSQALQEYAEVQPLYEAIHRQFATNGETIQMLGLLGYASQTPRTPRWPLETRLVNGKA
ncbi:MAG: twin-arginine translocation pathway signal protein [Pseudomonadota bacterium]